MNIYEVNLVCIFLCIGISAIFFPKSKKALVGLVFSQLLWLICLRNPITVGVDLYRYSIHYKILSGSSLKESFLYSDGSSGLYYLANTIFSKIGGSFDQFVILVSLFCVITVGWYIYKYSEKPILSIFIYMGLGTYLFVFSGLRQAIAMAFTLIAIDRYNNGMKFKTVLFTIIALLFHPTAVIVIPYFIISKIKIDKFVFLGYAFVVAIFLVFRVQIGEFITKIYDDGYVGRYDVSSFLGGTAIFLFAVFALFLFINYKYIQNKSEKEVALFHSMMMTIIVQLMSSYAYAFTRINYYNMQAFVTLTSSESLLNEKLNKRFRNGALLFEKVVTFLIVVLMIKLYLDNVNSDVTLLNYKFFWE